MPEFEKLVMRHGEFGVQEIIERIERIEGVSAMTGLTLEHRWNSLMHPVFASQLIAA